MQARRREAELGLFVPCCQRESRIIMKHEIRQRILREATPEEKERHQHIRDEIQHELPELKQWARNAVARHQERVAVGTVFTADETTVLEAIDDYNSEALAIQSRGHRP